MTFFKEIITFVLGGNANDVFLGVAHTCRYFVFNAVGFFLTDRSTKEYLLNCFEFRIKECHNLLVKTIVWRKIMGEMEFTELVSRLVIFIVVLLLSISIHEAGHAWMSWKFGDDTAYLAGRVTMNPIAHADLIGTIILPIFGFISASMGGLSLLGWGKPCPVNPRNWKDYKKANFWVSLAGVLGNLILVTAAFIGIKLATVFNVIELRDLVGTHPIGIFLSSLLFMNTSLILFNLLPFPPLDGSKILANFLPSSWQPTFDFLDQYGMIFLWILVISGVTRYIFQPVYMAVIQLLILIN